jgi:DNA modification methylase
MSKEIDLFGNEIVKDVLLRDKFIEPPFSVLDTKSGNWQGRKREWLRKGIKSEIGRDEDLTYKGNVKDYDYYRVKEGKKEKSDSQSTSIFDPALCELMYKWFCNEGGKILDPFAGGSVRE